MFEKKIEEVAKASRQKFLLLVMSVTIILLVLVVIFLLPGLFSSEIAPGQSGESSEMAAPGSNAGQTAPPAVAKTKTDTQDKANESSTEAQQLREQHEVTALIGRYEETLEPTVLKEGFAAWDRDRQYDLIQRKEEVISKLASGDIDSAYDSILDLMEQADASIAEYRDAVQIAIADAEAGLAQDDYKAALTAIDRALSLDAGDRKAQDLKQKIEALPELLDLIEQARVASVENNLEKERDILEQILEKDPSRGGYQDRLAEIKAILIEQRYERVIASGLQAHRAGKLEDLTAAHKQAKSLFPSREETENLGELLLSLKRQIAFGNFIRDAAAAIEADDWQRAQKGFENALTLRPDNPEATNGLAMSKDILKNSKAILAYLGKPERLSTETVKDAALQAIEEAEVFGALSQSLKGDIGKLQSEIEKMNREIDVLIVSDNTTRISVKGVGRVGQVDRYSIRLKPGSYMFEGKREGFRTKLVPVIIRPEDTSVRVEVITDERI